MKILFLTHDYPFPVRTGGQVYSGSILRGLAEKGSAVTAFCCKDGLHESAEFEEAGISWHCFPRAKPSLSARVLSSFPVVTVKCHSAEFRRALIQYLRESTPDVIVIDYIATAWTLDVLNEIYGTMSSARRPLTMYLSHNVEKDLRAQIAQSFSGSFPMRMMARFDAWRGARTESRLVAETDLTSVITEEDASRFQELFGPVKTLVVTPGYDGHYAEDRKIDESVGRNVAVLGGRLSTMKQIVLDSFLESAAQGIDDLGFATHVIGPMQDDYRERCRKKYPNVTFHGFVEDIRPLVSQMRLGVVADHVGGGFKLRILTYVFQRVPMIAVPEAMAGLPLEPGRDYIAVSDYDRLPEAIRRYGDDFAKLEEIQHNAYERCLRSFSWSTTAQRLTDHLRAAV